MAEDKKTEGEEELEIVGPGAEDESSTDESSQRQAAPQGDADDTDDDEGDGEEARLGHSEDEDEDREAKKTERQNRKQRQREARQRQETELNFLRQRNEALERQFSNLAQRQTRTEVLTVDQRINQTKAQLKIANDVIAAAIEQGKGADAVEATTIREQLQSQLVNLERAKHSLTSQSSEEDGEGGGIPAPTRRTAANTPPPQLVKLATAWVKDHSWYDPRNTDEDSALVTHLDNQLLRSGAFDPLTPEYYEELTRRVKRHLPHRFEGEDGESRQGSTPAKKSKSAPKFATGGRERPLASNQVYISADRKQAMIDAGVWDDPKLRNKYLAQYAKYDKEHGVGA